MTHQLGCGYIKNFISQDELFKIINIFRKVTPGVGSDKNGYYGIAQQHLAYVWFKKILLDRIADQFNPAIKLIFGMLVDSRTPLGIHRDLKDIPDPAGHHYLSFLIPYSVDDRPDLCGAAATLIFDESPDGSNNISDIHEQKLAHVPIEETYHYSLRQELIWNCGDLLWWDSRLAHASSNFLTNNHYSKQAIVIHTYVV
jgi:hypothetical protein